MTLGTHGVMVKTADCGKARWLTSDAGLTTKRIHAVLTTKARAEAYAKDLMESNPGVVEWARSQAYYKESK